MSTSALMELLQKTKKQVSSQNRQKTVTIPDNTSRWRILPGWSKDKPDFYHDFGLHYIKDSTKTLKAVYVCVDKTYGRPCSICNAIDTAINHTHDEATRELLSSSKATHRILLNALHLSGPSPLEPVILEVPKSVFAQIVNISEEWSGRTISAESDGIDLKIERTGKGLTTRYTVTASPKKSDVNITPAVMDKVTNLDDYVAQEDEKAASRALNSVMSVAGVLAPAHSGYATGGAVSASALGAAPVRPALAASLSEAVIEDAELKEIESTVLTSLESDDAELKEIEAAISTSTAKVEAPAATPPSTGDAEIDQYLKEMGL